MWASRKAAKPKMKKFALTGSNINNTSPAHENTNASKIHFLSDDEKPFVVKMKKKISNGISNGLLKYLTVSLPE